LDPGRTVKGEMLGPDGKPLAGARVSGLRTYGGIGQWGNAPPKTSAFTGTGLSPGGERLPGGGPGRQKPGGSPGGQGGGKGPGTVKLAASARLTGRLVTPDGQPVKDGELASLRRPIREPDRMKADPTVGSFPRGLHPDKEGRIRVEGLVPGLTYHLGLVK